MSNFPLPAEDVLETTRTQTIPSVPDYVQHLLYKGSMDVLSLVDM